MPDFKMPAPLPESVLSALRADFDFSFVFGEQDWGNTPPIGFTRADITEIFLVEYGEPDGAPWRCVGRLSDGRYFRASGGCDYTGWDCQARNEGETWPDLGAFVAGLGDADRALLGLGLDGLGSSHVLIQGGDSDA